MADERDRLRWMAGGEAENDGFMPSLEWESVAHVRGRLTRVTHDGLFETLLSPFRGFHPGWAARGVLTLKDAGFLLDLQHEDGRQAAWIFDSAGRIVTQHQWSSKKFSRDPQWQTIRPKFVQALSDLSGAFLRDPVGALKHPDLAALRHVGTKNKIGLLRFCVGPDIDIVNLDRSEDRDDGDAAIESARSILALDLVKHARTAFRNNQVTMPALNGTGQAWRASFVWYGVTGAMIQVQDTPEEPAWIASCHFGPWTSRGAIDWILLPDGRTVATNTDIPLSQVHTFLGILVGLYVAAAEDLEPWAVNPAGPALAYRPANGNHLGHLVWNNISGVDDLVSICHSANQKLIVYDLSRPPGCDIYGLPQQLFPDACVELVHGPQRPWEPIDAFLAAVRSRHHLMSFRLADVPRTVRRRVMNAVQSGVLGTAISPLARSALSRSEDGELRPVIALSLRLQNRTSPDLLDFYCRLVSALKETIGRDGMSVIIDGMNVQPDGRAAAETVKLSASSAIAIERRFVGAMRSRVECETVRIHSCVGSTMEENLIWLEAADVFVAPQGAGIVKFRWIHDIPGYILTSATNLRFSERTFLYSDIKQSASRTFQCNHANDVSDIFEAGDQFDEQGKILTDWNGGLSSVNFNLINQEKMIDDIREMLIQSLNRRVVSVAQIKESL